MSRKILSLIVAVAFVLTSFSSAFAATVPSDVTADFSKAVSKVQSLNIMIGDAGTGLFRPTDTIKRSEFAVVAVKAMGLNDTAIISAGATKFSDVAADNWASGYINAAVGAGLISGYPDGTYGPDKTINYAEALTILSNMLGYGPILAGKPWPGAYVAQANASGITSGVVMAPTVGASRGNVAKLVSNTLDSNILQISGYDANNKPTYTTTGTPTLMANKLSVTQITDGATPADKVFTVTNTPIMQSVASTTNATLADTNNAGAPAAGTYDGFVSTLNADDYLGLNIKAWANTDKKIVIAEVQNAASDIYEGVISKDSAKIKLVGNAASYEGAAGFVGYINASQAGSFASFVAAIGNDKATAKVILDNGKIAKAYAWVDKNVGASYSKVFTVKEVKDGYIKAINSVVSDIKIQTQKDNIATKTLRLDIVKDGTAATIDDVVAGDVVVKTTNGAYQRWVVSSTTATGTLSAVSGSDAAMSLTIGGTAYTIATDEVFSFNGGTDYDKAYTDIASVVGKEVTVKLNSVGQIQNLVSTAATATYYYGIFKSTATGVGTLGSDKNVVLYKADGTKVAYILEDSTNTIGATAGDLVQYQLTTGGLLKDDSFKYGNQIQTDLVWGNASTVSAIADNTLTVGSNVYSTLSSTVIFDVYNAIGDTDAISVVSFGAIKDKTIQTSATTGFYKILRDGITIKFIAAYSPNTAYNANTIATTTKGVVLATGYDADGQTVTINENGTVKTFKITTGASATDFVSKMLADYDVNSSGKINDVNSVGVYVYNGTAGTFAGAATVTGAVYRVTAIDTTTNVVTVKLLNNATDGMEYGSAIYLRYNSDTQIYDASDDSAPLTTIKGAQAETIIGAGDYIWVNNGDPTITLTSIIKVKKDNLVEP